MAKETHVTQQEKEKMRLLFREGNSFIKSGMKLHRSPDTVSRYMHEYEAVVQATGYILNRR